MASEDMYKDNVEGSIISGLASGVPGDLKGLEYLHQKYGVCLLYTYALANTNRPQALPWRVLCNPAIHVARYGFPGMSSCTIKKILPSWF